MTKRPLFPYLTSGKREIYKRNKKRKYLHFHLPIGAIKKNRGNRGQCPESRINTNKNASPDVKTARGNKHLQGDMLIKIGAFYEQSCV